ncbi:MAG: MOP flippase family protein [Deltaproteobacteria bacterium]|nr:MOP flippase family protein [Deltaproteobacteria bacterium]
MFSREKTLSGIAWNAASRVLNIGLQFVITIFLARLLTPADFGLVGMVIVFTGFAHVLSDPGFASALIQKRDIEESHLSSVFWLNILIGILLSGLFLSFSSLVAGFYHEPRLSAIVALIASIFFIQSFKMVPLTLLIRSLEFRKLAVVDTVTTLLAGVTAIVLALSGYGVWSLVWQTVVSAFASMIIVWWVSGWKPHLLFEFGAIRELLKFSMNLFGFNLYQYWVKNIDNLLIGKFIGSAGLGIYSRAYDILLMPVNQISATVGQVMFPALSKIKDDKDRFKDVYLEAMSGVAFIAFPLMMGLFVVADSFVLTLYGEKWSQMIPIVKVFCLLGVIYSIAATAGWIYSAQGRTDWLLLWGLGSGALIMISIAFGVYLGTPLAVAISIAVVSGAIHIYPQFTIPGKLINMGLPDVLRSVSGIFFCSSIMAGGVWLLGQMLPPSLDHVLRLLLQVPFGIVMYMLLAYTLKVRTFVSILSLIRRYGIKT